ncbi:MAG: RHS repeat-associated core domain-containing protein [Bacteroidota bacterium]
MKNFKRIFLVGIMVLITAGSVFAQPPVIVSESGGFAYCEGNTANKTYSSQEIYPKYQWTVSCRNCLVNSDLDDASITVNWPSSGGTITLTTWGEAGVPFVPCDANPRSGGSLGFSDIILDPCYGPSNGIDSENISIIQKGDLNLVNNNSGPGRSNFSDSKRCPGNNNGSVRAVVSNGAQFLKWEIKQNGTFKTYNNVSGTTMSYNNLTENTEFRAVARANAFNSSCGNLYKTFYVYMDNPPSAGTVKGDRTVYRNRPAVGTIEMGSGGINSGIDHWERKIGAGSWSDIGNSGSATLNYNQSFTDDTYYRVEMINLCGGAGNESNQVKITVVDQDPSWIHAQSLDENGDVYAETKSYFDYAGDKLQDQAKNFTENKAIASEPLYDRFERTVGSTLPAPLNQSTLDYNRSFFNYDYRNFDIGLSTYNPDPVPDGGIGTLGWYYRNNNTLEKAVATTSYPYSRQTFYDEGSGESKESAGPGNDHRMGARHEVASKVRGTSNTELVVYLALRDAIFPDWPTPNNLYEEGIVRMSLDPQGKVGVVYQDKDEKVLASGLWQNTLNGANRTNDLGNITSIPEADFIELSYNFYDNKGQLVASVAPNGVMEVIQQYQTNGGNLSYRRPTDVPFTNLYEYDFQGRLLAMTEPDAGRTEYIYRRDGKVRFSQNAEQRKSGNFSYTNYDPLGRPVESGEAIADVDVFFDFERNETPRFPNIEGQIVEDAGFDGEIVSGSTAVIVPSTGLSIDYFMEEGSTLDISCLAFHYANPSGGTPGVDVKVEVRDNQGVLTTMTAVSNGSWVNLSKSIPARTTGDITIKLISLATNTVLFDALSIKIDKPVTSPIAFRDVSMMAILESTAANGGIDGMEAQDWVKTYYDAPDDDDNLIRNQAFIMGAVSYSENPQTKTWYSYDELGRVTWMIQYVKELNKTFSLDYQYDFLGNVRQVAYQKDEQNERFYHHYEYDADKRLSKVYTSIDGDKSGETGKLQAAYEYYLHGPLKRVELADNMQGVDFYYTVQGWLKAINLPDGETQDNRSDIFWQSMHYYYNDYQRSGINTGSINISVDDFPRRYDGNVRAIEWGRNSDGIPQNKPQIANLVLTSYQGAKESASQSIRFAPGFDNDGADLEAELSRTSDEQEVADNATFTYAYQYDQKNQLQNAVFGENNDYIRLSTGTQNAVKGLTYDPNGNIQGLTRYDDFGELLDQFDNYEYLTGTNQLSQVSNYADYTYNAIGQMVYEKPTGGSAAIEKKIQYDVTGKVVRVADENDELKAEYAYDDRGFRLKKHMPGMGTTWYIRDASGNLVSTYEMAGDNPIQAEVPIYGASRIGDYRRRSESMQYEIADHLGNVRSVFTDGKVTYRAGFEVTDAKVEEQIFEQVAAARFLDHAFGELLANSGVASGLLDQRIIGTSEVGKSLRVKAGDQLTAEVYAKYLESVPDDLNTMTAISGWLTSMFDPTGVVGEGGALGTDPTGSGIGMLSGESSMALPPLAYLNYALFDNDYNDLQMGFIEVTQTAEGLENPHEKLEQSITIAQDGFAYIWISNNSPEDLKVWFDDFKIDHQSDLMLVKATDYYPFGMPIPGRDWSREAQLLEEEETPMNEALEYDQTSFEYSFEDSDNPAFPGIETYKRNVFSVGWVVQLQGESVFAEYPVKANDLVDISCSIFEQSDHPDYGRGIVNVYFEDDNNTPILLTRFEGWGEGWRDFDAENIHIPADGVLRVEMAETRTDAYARFDDLKVTIRSLLNPYTITQAYNYGFEDDDEDQHPDLINGSMKRSASAVTGSYSALLLDTDIHRLYYNVEAGDIVNASAWLNNDENDYDESGDVRVSLYMQYPDGSTENLASLGTLRTYWWVNESTSTLQIPKNGQLVVLFTIGGDENRGRIDDLRIAISSPTDDPSGGSPDAIAGSDVFAYRFGYQGQFAERDEKIGWNSFEARMYDARIGRWVSVDNYRQFHSPYVGMGNDPVKGYDRDGNWCPPCIGAIIGGGVSAGVSIWKNWDALTGDDVEAKYDAIAQVIMDTGEGALTGAVTSGIGTAKVGFTFLEKGVLSGSAAGLINIFKQAGENLAGLRDQFSPGDVFSAGLSNGFAAGSTLARGTVEVDRTFVEELVDEISDAAIGTFINELLNSGFDFLGDSPAKRETNSVGNLSTPRAPSVINSRNPGN